MLPSFEIIDISQPVSSESACFPGDVPFSKQVTVTFRDSRVINLTALTMSPHVGTHTDAPIHCYGELEQGLDTAGKMPLEPFVGPAMVVDLAPATGEIRLEQLTGRLADASLPERLLFKTAPAIRYEVFEEEYAYFSVELINFLAQKKVCLVGIDTPSVDSVRSKDLPAHHALIKNGMTWLENLDLTRAHQGEFFLCACPLKLMETEASPVRAILLNFN
jgi:arylformamidase